MQLSDLLVEYVPASQAVQLTDSNFARQPASHAVHDVAPRETPSVDEPAAHEAQKDFMAEGAYFPSSQNTHSVSLSAYSPALHATHLSRYGALKVPSGQS